MNIIMNIAEYRNEHKYCPVCGNGSIESTMMDYREENGKLYDPNKAFCHSCNWIGIGHDLVSYRDRHRYCPVCGNDSIESTCVGTIYTDPKAEVKDTNQATCQHCYWVGVVHDLVAVPRFNHWYCPVCSQESIRIAGIGSYLDPNRVACQNCCWDGLVTDLDAAPRHKMSGHRKRRFFSKPGQWFKEYTECFEAFDDDELEAFDENEYMSVFIGKHVIDDNSSLYGVRGNLGDEVVDEESCPLDEFYVYHEENRWVLLLNITLRIDDKIEELFKAPVPKGYNWPEVVGGFVNHEEGTIEFTLSFTSHKM